MAKNDQKLAWWYRSIIGGWSVGTGTELSIRSISSILEFKLNSATTEPTPVLPWGLPRLLSQPLTKTKPLLQCLLHSKLKSLLRIKTDMSFFQMKLIWYSSKMATFWLKSYLLARYLNAWWMVSMMLRYLNRSNPAVLNFVSTRNSDSLASLQ